MLRFSVLPLTTVAGLTPSGHEVVICDENVRPLNLDADVDLVGVSFMTALAPRAYEIAREFRRRGKTVVAGGYHPTLVTDEVARYFDAVVVGDAEGLWPQLVRDLEKGHLKPLYRHEKPRCLAETPLPRRGLTGQTAQHYVTTQAVQAGRGCRHACRYCSVTAFHHHTYRTRPLDDVLAEIERLERNFIFVDDNIIADPHYARRLFEAMVPLGKRWVSQASITIADDPELLRLARQAGCQGLFIGVETTSAENLAAVGKGFNQSELYAQRLRRIRRAGIGVIAGIIVGMDGDTVNVFERTLAFLLETHVDALQLNILTPLPGTPLFEDFAHCGRIVHRDWSKYDYRHVVIQPARMSQTDLQDGADWLYRVFYRLDRILLRALRTVVEVGPLQAWLGLRLGLTYRYDNKREAIVGRNPARVKDSVATYRKTLARVADRVVGIATDRRPDRRRSPARESTRTTDYRVRETGYRLSKP
jgi:radical SAM superfamily enzyme YgiQ (UPF0313 family)